MSKSNFTLRVTPVDGLDGQAYLMITARDPVSGRTEGRLVAQDNLLTASGELKLRAIILEMQKELTGIK